MGITLAKSSGFCFGVDRAVEMVNDLLRKGEKVCTLGPIIHNPQLVEELQQRGARIVSSPEEVKPVEVLVTRAHGVPKSIELKIAELGLPCADATCPFVSKIHRLMTKAAEEERTVLLAGDPDHPEVQGIVGHCNVPYFVFKNEENLNKILTEHEELAKLPIFIASQTTFRLSEWENCLKNIKKVCTNYVVFDTICNATENRQKEAMTLAQRSDGMVVIGGRHSSNTCKLRDVCAQYCPTFHVETAEELQAADFVGMHNIGITAGASTPASIIKEVLVTMTNIIEEANFEEMLEESLKSLNTDEKVRGVVVGIAPNEVYVDVGRKQAGFIPANELSNDPNAKPEDVVKIGDEIELLIMRTNDQEGTIMLSKKRVDAIKIWDDITAAKDSEEVLSGKVTDVIKGGVIVLYNGIRVFIPASQATAARGDSLDELLNTEVNFRIIEVNRQRRRAVGSIRSVLREERKAQQAKFWDDVAEGTEYTGTVKSLTNYGAFVDLGGVDGMVHISELSWNRIKHPSEVVSVGDTVNVYIKKLDREAGKISLGYKRVEDNPWEILKNQYPVGTVCEAEVVGMTTFGAFAKLLPGIDGLIHISQIADHRIEKPQDVLTVGDKVTVKVTDIDFDKKRVSLSIRAVIEDEAAAE